MWEYEELRVRAWKMGHHRFLILINGLASAADIVTLPRPPQDYRERFDEILQEDLGRRPRSGGRSRKVADRLRQLGRELFGVLLSEPLREAVSTCIDLAQKKGKRLRLRFQLAPQLADLPVEILCSPADEPLGELALAPSMSLVRSMPGMPHNLRLPGFQDPCQAVYIIVIVASPPGFDDFEVERELQAIEEGLSPFLITLKKHPIKTIGWPRSARRKATRSQISQRLKKQKEPCIVLLIGHGGYDEENEESYVYLETADGSSERVPADILKGLLTPASGLGLVVLNLCLGARTAPREPFSGLAQSLIGAGLPAVIAMQTEVSDEAASSFSPALLKAICENQTLDEAVCEGRLAMANNRKTSIEWCNPVLFLNERCGHSWIFKVRTGTDFEDPLIHGSEALHRVQQHSSIQEEDVDPAIDLLKKQQDWKRVARFAKLGMSLFPDDEHYGRIDLEAETETHLDKIQAVCRALSDDSGQVGELPALAELAEVLDPDVFAVLEREAAEASTLPILYEKALTAENQKDWSLATELYEEILERRPRGFRGAIEGGQRSRAWLEIEDAMGLETWDRAGGTCEKILACDPGNRRALALLRYCTARRAEERSSWLEARQIYAELRGDSELDAGARWVYVKARGAEEAERWEAAAEAYSAPELEGFPEVFERRLYALARGAEERGLWPEALKHLEELEKSYRDVRERRLYLRGCQAEREENWRGVVLGFGSLPDSFADGDVGLRRSYARARRAGQLQEWKAVVEALHDLPADYRDGDVGQLRGYALARAAEAQESWETAENAYRALEDGYLDVPSRHLHSRAKRAEEDNDWDEAVATLARLNEALDGLADGELAGLSREEVACRLNYARGRLAETQRNWSAAIEFFEQLGSSFRDLAERIVHARACAAEEKADWQEVANVLESRCRPGHPLLGLLWYARGCLAEEARDWKDAIRGFDASANYRDAASRRARIEGQLHEEAGRWSLALAAYRRIRTTPAADMAVRLKRLEKSLEVVPWADNLAGSTLVADPLEVLEGISPYEALELVGVTPNSSMGEILEASFTLMEQGVLTPEARLAWDRVRSLQGRLLVDALLYRLQDSVGFRQRLSELVPESADAVLKSLCRVLPADAPLFHLLAGQRDEAIDAWEEQLAIAQDSTSIVHSLAIASFWLARTLESSGAFEQAEAAWESAIARWARLLNEDSHWDAWRHECASRYAEDVSQSHIARLRRQLGHRFSNSLDGYAEHYLAHGMIERAEIYRELALSFAVELEGAMILKQAGGLPGPKRRGLVCGPLYLRQAELGPDLARRVATLEAQLEDREETEEPLTALGGLLASTSRDESNTGATPELLYRLRCTFSELGLAFVFLERQQPEQTLRALPDHFRQSFRNLAPDCGEASLRAGHIGSCPRCRELLDRNPAYAGLSHRSARLFQDAVGLGTRAHLELARSRLLQRREGIGEALEQWRQALEVARRAGARIRTKRVIVRVVVGRVEALIQERGDQRGERLSDAIQLLEAVRQLIGSADQGQLAAKQAQVLTDRGVWHGSFDPPDYERAANDLRSALSLTPDSLDARDGLARALSFHASNLSPKTDARRSLDLLTEALVVLHEGLSRIGKHPQLLDRLDETLSYLHDRLLHELSNQELLARINDPEPPSRGGAEASELALRLLNDALEKRRGGDLNAASLLLVEAVRTDTAEPSIRRQLIETMASKARRLK